ncbi:hypothetical protein [Oryzomonas rubra]|uniref:Uncharacterized protein n=1 Tax=Oryzomonas rubra TaxID=2509454 RepID=A0A5A9X935_9BACT|nr:hypothetical protein [Oryzomonas rubra]KAA0888709.1 hypothetical protein ET418_15120 [Oryzomonas rubra]
MTQAEEGEPCEPTLSLDPGAAQELMDELYRVGIRPTEAVDSTGELNATKYHLEDMRKLALQGKEREPQR